VYDVSRWGRFQDADESAYYEFLCKNAGMPIHYCAEQFVNDGAMPNVLMKALKRAMAAEYSRELSRKVFDGEKRISKLGFWVGSAPGYGLRRMLCSSDGTHKQIMNLYERKNLSSDRVTLVPGSAEEVETVRRMFRMILQGRTTQQTADHLNRRGIRAPRAGAWCTSSVWGIVTNPKYTGTLVWARSTSKLGQPNVKVPESEWVTKKQAFEPIVDEHTFVATQNVVAHTKSDQYLLDCLRSLLTKEGSLCRLLMRMTSGMPSEETYVTRFGSLRKAFAMVGFEGRSWAKSAEILHGIRRLRTQVLAAYCRAVWRRCTFATKNIKPPTNPLFSWRTTPASRSLQIYYLRHRTAAMATAEHMKWTLPMLLCWCNCTNTAILRFSIVHSMPPGKLTLRANDMSLRGSRSAPDVCALLEDEMKAAGIWTVNSCERKTISIPEGTEVHL
jgi:DNA invertase Pin-like site-specific DNA recombinase